LGTADAPLLADVRGEVERHLAFLRKTAPKEDPITSGLPANTRPEGCPDPTGDPEVFLKWADKRMAAINDPEELALIWTEEIDPLSDGLMKPSYEDLEAIHQRHEKRLGGE
jgi:hypothetical protein